MSKNTSHTGSTYALASWFTPGRDLNKPAEDFEREEILSDVYLGVQAYAVSGSRVIVRTAKGRCLMEAKTLRGCEVVTFDYVSKGRWEHFTFWMNASSVKDLGDVLRAHPELREDFTDLMINE